MATCVTWKQPDANHFNGFCTNKFRLTTPPYEVRVDNGCDVCVKPTSPTTLCDLYGSGSDAALFNWYGQYYIGPSIFSITPSTNWRDTWRPFLNLNIPEGLLDQPGAFGDGSELNPGYFCPSGYTGDFRLKSNDHCSKWIGFDPVIGSQLQALAVAEPCEKYSEVRFELFPPRISNPSEFLLWVELKIRYRIFSSSRDIQIRCRTAPQATSLFFNMGGTLVFNGIRNAVSGSPWVDISTNPIVVTQL